MGNKIRLLFLLFGPGYRGNINSESVFPLSLGLYPTPSTPPRRGEIKSPSDSCEISKAISIISSHSSSGDFADVLSPIEKNQEIRIGNKL